MTEMRRLNCEKMREARREETRTKSYRRSKDHCRKGFSRKAYSQENAENTGTNQELKDEISDDEEEVVVLKKVVSFQHLLYCLTPI